MKFSLSFCAPFVRDDESELVIACGQDAELERMKKSQPNGSTMSPPNTEQLVLKPPILRKRLGDTQEQNGGNKEGTYPSFDYDTDKGELFYHLENRNWDAAVTVARACPEQAYSWVTRKNSDGSVRWRILPIHAAVIFDAPSETIKALLIANPESIQAKDDGGNHPLLLAYSLQRSESVTGILAEHYVSSSKKVLEDTKKQVAGSGGSDKYDKEAKLEVPESSAAVACRSEGTSSSGRVSGSIKDTSASAIVSQNVGVNTGGSVSGGLKCESASVASAAEARDDVEETKEKQMEKAKVEEAEMQYGYANATFDYDADKGEMFSYLEDKNWGAATLLAKGSPSEARHWIKRRNSHGNQRWRMLPIHCAIIFGAPVETIQALLEAYPEGIAAKDDRGIHPLQLAYRLQRSANITNFLEEYYVYSKTHCWPIKEVENITI